MDSMPVSGSTPARSDRRKVGAPGAVERLDAAAGEAIGMFISWETVETWGSGICTPTKKFTPLTGLRKKEGETPALEESPVSILLATSRWERPTSIARCRSTFIFRPG